MSALGALMWLLLGVAAVVGVGTALVLFVGLFLEARDLRRAWNAAAPEDRSLVYGLETGGDPR